MNTDAFIKAVERSRMLSTEQKELLLEDPESFSPEYREHVMALLTAFNERSRSREEYLREHINVLLNNLYDRLEVEQIPDAKRKEILEKAMNAVKGAFPPS